jgi:hypothetical protein
MVISLNNRVIDCISRTRIQAMYRGTVDVRKVGQVFADIFNM